VANGQGKYVTIPVEMSRLSAYFRRFPGFISDVSTLKTTVKALGYLDQKRLTFILDRGFYSESEVRRSHDGNRPTPKKDY
jgi:transposase